MRFIEIPEIPKIHGKKAIQALNEFISELKEQKNKELTRKQKAAMIKLARGLISSIEAEMQAKASSKGIRKMRFVKQLKETIRKHIVESDRADDNDELRNRPSNSSLRFSSGAAFDWDVFSERTLPK